MNLIGWLQLVNIDDLVRAGLHESLTSVIDRIHDLGHAIHHTYFDFQIGNAQPAEAALPEQSATDHLQGKGSRDFRFNAAVDAGRK